MLNFKKWIKPAITLLVMALIYLTILVVLHYTGLLKLSSVSKINFVVSSIVMLILGISIGKKTSKKGYLEGIKIGLIIIGILFLLNTILYRTFSLYLLVYYLIILTSSIIGSMIGINLKH